MGAATPGGLGAIVPVVFTILAWWLGTRAVHHLATRPRHTHPRTMALGTLALLPMIAALAASGGADGPAAAYLGFSLALLLWGWQELAFLLGYVTGPRRLPCPPDAGPLNRVRYAVQVLLHHELALLALAGAVWWATPAGGSRAALWTFAALWVLRLSAKLNLFLGARNLQAEMLPPHLRYLASYFRRRPMNGLFPWSMLASLAAVAALVGAATADGTSAHDHAALLLVATLVALGALEHGLMMWPMPARPADEAAG
ncbi:putative photosynthetic complex assembly protein PuhE [Piscinibacter sakaiensis]|uniref:Photosynthetic complex assembly protein 2 n=1 Tax=Piscinibacter sakaiensis TaxID=1547922 RepID=A0A0K8NVH2_PISS1|nr:putative photosynthetic complex assembly protein PuhE [Piscinibacter sakaiensis]GAP34378.1 hypothetical protein ISF6_4553 [Piscinibacter sakaiensis]